MGCPAARWAWPGRDLSTEEGNTVPKGLLREFFLLVPQYWCQKKKNFLKDPMSLLRMGALLLGALSQGEVPQHMAERGTCTAGALWGPAIFLLERMTLSNGLVFPIMDQIQVSWLFGGQRNGPPLSRDFRTCPFNSSRSSVTSRETGPTKGFISFSFSLPPDRGCAEILRVISLKPRGA